METEASRPGVLARGPLGTVARRGGGPGLSEAEDAHGSQSRSRGKRPLCLGAGPELASVQKEQRLPQPQGKDEQPQRAEASARGVCRCNKPEAGARIRLAHSEIWAPRVKLRSWWQSWNQRPAKKGEQQKSPLPPSAKITPGGSQASSEGQGHMLLPALCQEGPNRGLWTPRKQWGLQIQ